MCSNKMTTSDSVLTLLSDLSLDTINALGNEELISQLCTAISLMEEQHDLVSELEDKVSCLENSLYDKTKLVECLENEATQMKISFAEALLCLQRPAAIPFSGPSGTSYASVVRGPVSSSVLVAKCVDGAPSDNLDLLAV